MPPIPPITQALLLIHVGIFCIAYLAGNAFQSFCMLSPIGSGFMPWQVVTYSFLSPDTFSLFLNMLGLWMFGSELELLWGRKRFMHFYAACVVSAALVHLLWSALTVPSVALGPSSILFGFLMAYGMIFPERTIMPLFPPIPMKAKYFVVLFGGIELVQGLYKSNGLLVAHFSHLGGMLGGFLLIQYWRQKPPFGKR
jgi:membrane associated rhomboid family serine protease